MIDVEQFLHANPPVPKNALTVYKDEYVRSDKHSKYVKKQPCCITQHGEHCNQLPVDPHHLMDMGGHAMALKESDEWQVPLCRMHHNQVTVCGKEQVFWKKWGIDSKAIAIHFALTSPDENVIRKMVGYLREEGHKDDEIQYMAIPDWV